MTSRRVKMAAVAECRSRESLATRFHSSRAQALIKHSQSQALLVFSAGQMGFFVLGEEGQWSETPRTWGTCGSEVKGSFDSWLTLILDRGNE